MSKTSAVDSYRDAFPSKVLTTIPLPSPSKTYLHLEEDNGDAGTDALGFRSGESPWKVGSPVSNDDSAEDGSFPLSPLSELSGLRLIENVQMGDLKGQAPIFSRSAKLVLSNEDPEARCKVTEWLGKTA